ncbi:MAG: bifunctional riboflavin kinase/FAD synthetase [Alphaproteobacteria bacterium]
MILIRNLNQIKRQLPPIALTIGNFDGVHLAHQKIIATTQEIAQKNQLKTAILTFEPHPILFLNKNNSNFNQNFRIYNLANKIRILKQFNIDYFLVIPFNNYLSSLNHNSFVEEILINKFNTKSLIIGYDFTFGKNRQGNFKTLENYNFDLHEINPIKFNKDLTISSSQARNFIKNGDIKNLNLLLGKNYQIDGLVQKGNQIGHKIGFATANLLPKSQLILPKFGVYKTKIFIPKMQKLFSGITNFGIKPTINQNQLRPIFETHIFDFNFDIYGQKIVVIFEDFIRDEMKFSSLEHLKQQIHSDILQVKIF